MARPKKVEKVAAEEQALAEEQAAGGVEIILLCVYGGNQPGDKVSVSKEVAE